jgi:hypothetical protein
MMQVTPFGHRPGPGFKPCDDRLNERFVHQAILKGNGSL